MAQILVENLTKTFQVAKRRAGLWGALTGLVHRTYHDIPALAGIDFTIEESELVGYIGPNGAGKSTTVKILSGILVPSAGRCEVNGVTPWKNRLQHVQNIGVVFGQRTQLWWDLPVVESFEVLRAIYRIPAAVFQKNKARLIELLQLQELLDIPVRQLSLGQRMRGDTWQRRYCTGRASCFSMSRPLVSTLSQSWRCGILSKCSIATTG